MVSSQNLVTPPVTQERVLAALESLGFAAMTDSEGDVAISFFPYLFFIVTQNRQPFLGVGGAPRMVDVQHADTANSAVAHHNAHFYIPKMYTLVSDDGKISFRLSHCFNWDAGATDEQISTEIDAFLRGAMEGLTQLEQIFPDPWAEGSDE